MEVVTKNDLNVELKKIKKKEQELYKFILQQFMDLENYKKNFSSKISSEVENIINEIALKGINLPDLTKIVQNIILEHLPNLKGDKGDKGDKGEIDEEFLLKLIHQVLENEYKNVRNETKENETHRDENLETVRNETHGDECLVEEENNDNILELTINNDVDIKTSLLKGNITLFLRMTNKPKVVLPEPVKEFMGKKIMILNTCNQSFKISIEKNGKFGTVNEKTLTKNGHYLNIVCDGQKYFIL